jgi:hypothetical protein
MVKLTFGVHDVLDRDRYSMKLYPVLVQNPIKSTSLAQNDVRILCLIRRSGAASDEWTQQKCFHAFTSPFLASIRDTRAFAYASAVNRSSLSNSSTSVALNKHSSVAVRIAVAAANGNEI